MGETNKHADDLPKKSQTVDELNRVISKTVPLSGIRRIISEKMRESLDRSPQATITTNSVDVTHLVKTKEEYNAQALSVSYTDLFVFLVSRAIVNFPELNASRQNNKIIFYETVNIGVAVARGSHLIVPVIKEVQDKSISQISSEMKVLIDKVKDDRLTMDDVTGGTFSITNLGMLNVDSMVPILNPPEAAILSIGAIRKEPIVVGNEIEVKPTTTLSLTIDHAVVDGATAAKFLNEIRRLCAEGDFDKVAYKGEKYVGETNSS